MIKNLVVKIQNLVLNHESQILKLNPVYVYAYICVYIFNECVCVCVCVCVDMPLISLVRFFVAILGLTCV